MQLKWPTNLYFLAYNFSSFYIFQISYYSFVKILFFFIKVLELNYLLYFFYVNQISDKRIKIKNTCVEFSN